MRTQGWGDTRKIIPWKEYLGSNSILDIPLPKRDKEDISPRGIKEGDSEKVGFGEGRLDNGYPFRLECAVYGDAKIISVFVSKMGLIGITGEELNGYLQEQGVYEVYGASPEIYDYTDKAGHEFWRVDVILESEGDIYASSPVSIEAFSYGHMEHELRLLVKEGQQIFKVYYNEHGEIAGYALCQKKPTLFKLKFDCYALPILEMGKLAKVLAIGKGDKNVIQLLEEYLAINSMEDLLGLLKEYRISYSTREEY